MEATVTINGQQVTGNILLGRREILTDATEITAENVVNELVNALNTHRENRNEIKYLWNYYRGLQDIQLKEVTTRQEINNKVTVNRANEIVAWKVDYLTGEPITYISTVDDDSVRDNVNKLNKAMRTLGKQSEDQDLMKWDMVCGIAYRFIEMQKGNSVPFKTYSLDPRNTFVVKSSNIRRTPMFAVVYHDKVGNTPQAPMVNSGLYQNEIYEIYTDKWYFKIQDGNIAEQKPNYLRTIPVIEYPANKERQGAFEVVIPLLNMLNDLYSDRLDGLERYVQSFLKFVNCDIDAEGMNLLQQYGAIKIKSDKDLPADVDIVATELSQTDVQTLANSVDAQINVICGLPNRNGGLSTSDTGRAVELRDGFVTAEQRAKSSETIYKESDKKALEIIFKICKATHYFDLNVEDVDSKFTRRNYENLQSKSQVLIAMLQQDKLHPKLAFECSGMFTDPEGAYTMSMDWWEERQKEVLEQMQNQMQNPATTPSGDGNIEQRSSKTTSESKEISNPILKSATETKH